MKKGLSTVFTALLFFGLSSCISVNTEYKATENNFCFQPDHSVLVVAFIGDMSSEKFMEDRIVEYFRNNGFSRFYSLKEYDPFGKFWDEGNEQKRKNLFEKLGTQYLLIVGLTKYGVNSKYIPQQERTTIDVYGNSIYANKNTYGGYTVAIPDMAFEATVNDGNDQLALIKIATGASWFGHLASEEQIYRKTANRIFTALSGN